MKLLLTRLDRAGRFVENLALVILLSGMMLLAVGQIAMREIFSSGLIWADELIKLIVLWLALFGSIAACRDNRHIRIDALSHLLSAIAVSIVRIVVDTFAAVVCFVIAWHAWRYLKLEIEFGDTLMVNTPAWIAHMVVPFAFAVLGYRFLVLVGQQVIAIAIGPEPEPESES
ncbi:MAG TPA: TRAP transporter small permease [Woeseiaceae bacterium]|nr:TRAP transporter small permease [Woeseiaceae bacterium]